MKTDKWNGTESSVLRGNNVYFRNTFFFFEQNPIFSIIRRNFRQESQLFQ